MPPLVHPDEQARWQGGVMEGTAYAGGPAETRARLLAAALRAFGMHGEDGISTRELAAEAGTPTNAITYHFGGKQGLYRAVAAHIVESTGAVVAEAAAHAARNIERLPPAAAAGRAAALLAEVARTILMAPDAGARAGYILREQFQPSAAFDTLYAGFIAPAHETLTALVARATGEACAEAALLQAHALFGSAIGFGIARETLRRRLGVDRLGAEHAERVAQALSHHALRALGHDTSQETPHG